MAGAWAATHLGLKTSRIELTGADLPFARRHLALEAEFGDLNRIVVAVRGQPADCRRYAQEFAQRLVDYRRSGANG